MTDREIDRARAAADRLADSVAAPEVRGGLAMLALRSALRWALARGSVGARRAAQAEGWARRASEGRLRAQSLRHVAWTLVLEDDRSADPAARAAAIVGAALAFRRDLAAESNAALLFGTTLVPGPDRFEVHRGGGRHVLVGVAGELWAVDVLDASGSVLDGATLAAAFRACAAARSRTGAEGPPILALTAAPRGQALESWPAIARASPAAASLLSEAILSVFFDPATPSGVDACGRLAQGGPVANRCFWHALQVVVFKNARAAIVGSFVAGVAADGALEIGARLGRADGSAGAPRSGAPPLASPVRLSWTVDARGEKALAHANAAASEAVDAGGFLRVPGFGRGAWTGGDAPPSPEGAIVVALRMALDAVVPELDELECMVGLAHVEPGLVTRLGTTTPEMRALLAATRKEDPVPGGALGDLVAAALAAHRARVGAAKRRESAEVAFEFAALIASRLGAFTRGVVAAAARVVAFLIALRTAPGLRRELSLPLVAIDSSVPRPPGIAGVGRFGVLAPPRSIWIHHSLADDAVSFVLQLGPDYVARAGLLRRAIPVALETVLRATGSPAPPVSREAAPPATRLAYRRLLGLLGALQTARPRGKA